MSAITEAAAQYRRHGEWRRLGKEPWRCPAPTASDVIDAVLDRLGITERPERDKVWASMIGDAFERAEGPFPAPDSHFITPLGPDPLLIGVEVRRYTYNWIGWIE